MTRFSRMHVVAAVVAILAGAASLAAGPQNNVMNQDTPDKKEIRGYTLTADKLTRYEGAVKAFEGVMKSNPGLQDKLDAASQNNAGPNTIAQSVAALDKFPQLTAAIKPFGFGSHEYIVMTYALVSAFGYVETKKSSPNLPMPLTVSAANAAFVASNEARIQALIQMLQG
ncbi:MAG: hypothetical protein WBF35_11870 [Candidatus Acidiferrales bacterium]